MKPAEGSTVIGKSVTIRGELSGKEDLYMDGTVEGTITLPESRLTVGPNARVLADLAAQDVVIYGFVEGNIRATGRIELRESAVVKGDIAAERLSIEENASIKGRVELVRSQRRQRGRSAAHADLFGTSAPTSTLPDLRRRPRDAQLLWRQRSRPAPARCPMSAFPRHSSGWGQLLERMRSGRVAAGSGHRPNFFDQHQLRYRSGAQHLSGEPGRRTRPSASGSSPRRMAAPAASMWSGFSRRT